jgi:membrane-associated phospholipid phosphatase
MLLALVAAPLWSNAVHADVDRERRLGDHLSLALPIGILAVELWRGDRAGAWQMAEVFALTTGVTEVLKNTTKVSRPDGTSDTSFPSGHAARAYSAAAYVHHRHGWDKAWPLWAAATYVGHTRVQARRHRWSEVAVSGALAYGFAHWRVERWVPNAQAQAWVMPSAEGWQAGVQLRF